MVVALIGSRFLKNITHKWCSVFGVHICFSLLEGLNADRGDGLLGALLFAQPPDVPDVDRHHHDLI